MQRASDLMRRVLKQLEPPPNITLSQWADQYRILSNVASAEPGKWRTDRAPYQREMMDAISDNSIRKIVVMSASQIGKTDMGILNPVGYFVHYDPTAIMVMEPTLDMSELLSKTRLAMMIRDTPVLRERIDERSRTSGNTILQKNFPGGQLKLVGANSPASLASQPIRVLLADELDRYPPSAGDEGDPLFLAEQRTKTYWNRKIVVTSTPTIRGQSRIETEYQNSTMGEWTLPCPQCGAMQTLEWGKIVFDSKHFLEGKRDVYMVCEACGAVSTETQWKAGSSRGTFRHQHPERETVGFFINGLASTFSRWEDIVQKFLEANQEARAGNKEMLKSWTNTELGQTWVDEGNSLDESDIANRKEKYLAEAPEGVACITVGVDVQDNRFELEYVGWGEGKESWGLGYVRLPGDLKQKAVWDELDKLLLRTFQKSDGTVLRVLAACIDTGGHFYNQVCAFCKPRQNRSIYAIHGVSGMEKPFTTKPSYANRSQTPLYNIGVDVGKCLVMDRLEVKNPGPGYCHYPMGEEYGYDEDYFKGLTAEKRVVTYRKGWAMYTWELKQKGYRRNEPFDVRDYATAALEITDPNMLCLKGNHKTRKPGRRQISHGIQG